MNDIQRTYLPAAGRDWALPLDDPFVKLLGGDAAKGGRSSFMRPSSALIVSSMSAVARARWQC